ncbi:hypothetical protein [Bradyrhizobium neotropicale]|uniref:hypothetical protein n=1 Tax=Bradyrhizobium neotropicale TaxID=1497615 RepID=UPI001AD62E2E|nr:hypothetical protein [Bradyrhizobium neotropicale]MBO4228360.1 hypothetical protein [Bradyrhizobium neotropicale]
MKRITQQEFQSIAPRYPLWAKAGRGWYQHGELLGIVLEDHDRWSFSALRKGPAGSYDDDPTFRRTQDVFTTYESAEAALEKTLHEGPHPFEAELWQLIAKYTGPQATYDSDYYPIWSALETATAAVSQQADERFPPEDEGDDGESERDGDETTSRAPDVA